VANHNKRGRLLPVALVKFGYDIEILASWLGNFVNLELIELSRYRVGSGGGLRLLVRGGGLLSRCVNYQYTR
jgi:hypothetical protein